MTQVFLQCWAGLQGEVDIQTLRPEHSLQGTAGHQVVRILFAKCRKYYDKSLTLEKENACNDEKNINLL